MQASLLRELDDDMAVHLLPPLHLAPGGPPAYLPSPSFSAAAQAPPAGSAAGACVHPDLSAGSGAEPAQLPNQTPAPRAAVDGGAADGPEAKMDSGSSREADRAPNPALVELARLAASGRLQRAAETRAMVADLALARLVPLLSPGAGTSWPSVLMAGAICVR